MATTLVIQAPHHVLWSDIIGWAAISADARLPCLELDAHTNYLISVGKGKNKTYRASVSLFFIDLPVMSISAGMGSNLSKVLPSLEISATGASGSIGTLASKTAALQIDARTGISCGDIRLPVAELDASMAAAIVCSLDKYIPGLTISATGSTPVICTLDKRLTFPSLEISISVAAFSSLSKSIPGMQISATVLSGETADLSTNLPCLRFLTAATAHQQSMGLDTTLPGGSVGGGGSMSVVNTSRFTDYVLRYSR